jgi:YVTN family beta-propeller protein
VKLRPGLLAAIAALCIAAGVAHSQYIEDSIDVGGGWVGSLVHSSELDDVWGSSWGGNSVFAIDCDSNRVVATLALSNAGDVAYDAVDGKLYCAYYRADAESLAVINAITRQVIKRLAMPGSTTPVWDAVSNRVYVSCQTTNSVAVVDTKGDSVLTYVPVGACPIKLYINTLRRKLYVLNYDDGTVSIVDIATNQVIKTVDVGGTPNAGYYCRSADKFYSAGAYTQCAVIGGQSDTIAARIPLSGNVDVISAAGNEDDGYIYLGTRGDGDDYVATVSSQSDSVLATAVIGRRPWGLLFYSGSGLLHCTSTSTDAVSVLTIDGKTIVTTLQVGDAPYVFAAAPRHNRLYLGHMNGRYVYVLRDTTTGAIMEPQSPHLAVRGVSVSPNPFTQSVAFVRSHLAKGGDVARVYAQDGRIVRQAQIPAGEARWVWDGRNDSGALLPPGVYVIEARPGLRAKVVKLK